jgi:hypothetical protein
VDISDHREEEEGNDEKHHAPSCPICKVTLTALSVLDSKRRFTDVDGSVIKAVDAMQEFVYKK